MHDTQWSKRLAISADGTGQVGHVGGIHLRLLAQRTGLTGALSRALGRDGFDPVHDRGQVLTDLACVMVLGGTCLRDVRLLEHQRQVIGATASLSTTWRTLAEIDEVARRKITRARAMVRRHVWALLEQRPEGFPWVKVDGIELTGITVIDTDGSVIPAPSEKDGASGTHKQIFGHHPLLGWCDNTGELLAEHLRPGKATANDAGDNIALLAACVAQLPGPYRKKILFRVDGAGFSHAQLAWIAGRGGRTSPSYRWEYSVGWAFTEREQAAVELVEAAGAWEPATGDDGDPREDAFVADITGLLGDLSAWPTGHRVIVRCEPLHPRYLKDASAYEKACGKRFQTFATNTCTGQTAWLDARHRKHSRVEPKIRDVKACGMGLLSAREMKTNAAWLLTVAIATDLRAWFQLLACEGELAKAIPKTLRYRMLHVPARLVRGGRKRRLKIPATWPWAKAITAAFARILALPVPT